MNIDDYSPQSRTRVPQQQFFAFRCYEFLAPALLFQMDARHLVYDLPLDRQMQSAGQGPERLISIRRRDLYAF